MILDFKKLFYGNSETSKVYYGNTLVYTKSDFDENYLNFTAKEAGSTFGLAKKNNTAELQYSLDKGNTWIELNAGDVITLANVEDKVYFKGKSISGSTSNYTQFNMTGKLAASGNIMSILTMDITSTELPHKCCCYELFRDCTALITPPELPATTLAEECYSSMFRGCTALESAPELLSETLTDYCYRYMFYGCSALTTAPALPATTLTLQCYRGMFEYCTALTAAPALPAIILANYCYYAMFLECTSIEYAPILPAADLAINCYYAMFKGCSSLKTLPDLPAGTLADSCYGHMFENCTEIKLSATTISKYRKPYKIPSEDMGIDASESMTDMFAGTGGIFTSTPTINTTYYLWDDDYKPDYLCFTALEDSTVGFIRKNSTGELNYSTDGINWTKVASRADVISIPAGTKVYWKGYTTRASATSGNENYTLFKMTGTIEASGNIMSILVDGDFASALELPHDTCCYCMFKDCTSLVAPPELPATGLLSTCYYSMFQNTGITRSPYLPATTLKAKCYTNMFNNCDSLVTVNNLPATVMLDYCYLGMYQASALIKLSTTRVDEYQTAYAFPTVTTAANWNTNMFASTGGTWKSSPVSGTTYYTANTVV